MSKIALFDLDNTLVDYISSYNSIKSKIIKDLGYDDTVVHTAEQEEDLKRLIQSKEGFWKNLKTHRPGWEVLSELERLEYSPHIVTKAPKACPRAWMEKLEWRNKHLFDLPLTISEDKSIVYGDVLVEDWPKYYEPWLERWTDKFVIIIDQPWNRDSNPKNSYRYAGDKEELRKIVESL